MSLCNIGHQYFNILSIIFIYNCVYIHWKKNNLIKQPFTSLLKYLKKKIVELQHQVKTYFIHRTCSVDLHSYFIKSINILPHPQSTCNFPPPCVWIYLFIYFSFIFIFIFLLISGAILVIKQLPSSIAFSLFKMYFFSFVY